MNRDGPAAPGPWLQIDLSRAGTDVTVTVKGYQSEQTHPHTLGPVHTLETVRKFGEWVKKAAQEMTPLTPLGLEAQKLHAALFQSETLELLHKAQAGPSQTPILLRLMAHDPELQAVPWEILCPPGTENFLGISSQVCVARGVHSTKPWQPREVRGAVRLLVISPEDSDAPDRLRSRLHPQIESGEIEWLSPLTGRQASPRFILDRLESGTLPHILHFIGHGRVTLEEGPCLRLADKEGEETWLKVSRLATALGRAFDSDLRLVVLEACELASPVSSPAAAETTAWQASAAERLAEAGADAVLAHLWPVAKDVARQCSASFYSSLAGATAQRGDVVRSLHTARRVVLGEFKDSAEAFSPVIYLRGNEPTLFDFKGRKVMPRPAAPQGAPISSADPAVRPLMELLERPFSLMLGDQWSATQDGFREALSKKLRTPTWTPPHELPLSSLTQRYALYHGETRLQSEFRNLFRESTPSLPLVEALARRLPPGVHITLLRLPILESTLAASQPRLPLYVIQPSLPPDPSVLVHQYVEGKRWVLLEKMPDSFNPKQEIAIVRLYRGYRPDGDFDASLFTEDDYLRLHALDSVLPDELADSVLGSSLYGRPSLFLGMSLLSWDHRMLLHRIFSGKSLSNGSTVLLESTDDEGDLWRKGRGLPGGKPLQVVQMASERLAELIGEGHAGEQP